MGPLWRGVGNWRARLSTVQKRGDQEREAWGEGVCLLAGLSDWWDSALGSWKRDQRLGVRKRVGARERKEGGQWHDQARSCKISSIPFAIFRG